MEHDAIAADFKYGQTAPEPPPPHHGLIESRHVQSRCPYPHLAHAHNRNWRGLVRAAEATEPVQNPLRRPPLWCRARRSSTVTNKQTKKGTAAAVQPVGHQAARGLSAPAVSPAGEAAATGLASGATGLASTEEAVLVT